MSLEFTSQLQAICLPARIALWRKVSDIEIERALPAPQMRSRGSLLIAGVLLAHVAFGQAAAPRPVFETADVHTSAPGTREEGGFLPEGRFECRGTTMLKLISIAYGVGSELVVGGPDWLTTDRFDVAAKAPTRQASRADLVTMLRNLLADRFGLTVREEQKDMPVYLLAVGKKGPKLRASANPQAPECPAVAGDPAMHHRACRDFSMAGLSKLLPKVAYNYVDYPVVDTTGLKGTYNFQLDWMGKAAYLAAKADGAGSAAVSMFDALEKLGLKLDLATRPAQVVVVSHLNSTPAEDVKKGTPVPAQFDVAEVRLSKSTTRQEGLSALPDGEVDVLGYTLRELIALAFEVKADRIAGGPKWLETDRFDVIAKSSEAMSPHAIVGMLKSLIVDRFNLKTHNENQPVPVLGLVIGKTSPNLKKTDGTARSECNLLIAEKGRTYNCRNTTLAQLAERLPTVAQAYFTLPLVDLTGLKSAYDFSLTWTPQNQLARVDPSAEASTPTGDVTVFEAIDKQLGLKIEQRKHPMPVLVIDQAVE